MGWVAHQNNLQTQHSAQFFARRTHKFKKNHRRKMIRNKLRHHLRRRFFFHIKVWKCGHVTRPHEARGTNKKQRYTHALHQNATPAHTALSVTPFSATKITTVLEHPYLSRQIFRNLHLLSKKRWLLQRNYLCPRKR